MLWAALAKIAAASISSSSPEMGVLDFAPGAQRVFYRSQWKQYREINVSAKINLNTSVKSRSSFVITSFNCFARSLPVQTWSARRPAPGTKSAAGSAATAAAAAGGGGGGGNRTSAAAPKYHLFKIDVDALERQDVLDNARQTKHSFFKVIFIP